MQTKLTETPAKKESTIAEELAKKQREISVAEFFTKNRHLLGFDNPRKSLLTSIKEACDNSLDATEEAKILPEITVEVKELAEDRYKIAVEDNGPGIVKEQVPKVFGKLLYGSKFHRYRQSLTADEPIIYKQEGKVKIAPIGKLIDTYLGNEGGCTINNLEVPCFDWKAHKYSWKPVSHLIKHRRENEILKITAQYGKQIKVTGCHSLFTINKNTLQVEEIEARNLQKGSIVLAPKTLHLEENRNEVNILDYLEEDYCKKRYWYLYTKKEIIQELFANAKIIHKKTDKSRKYYRITNQQRTFDILDGSYKQYITKGFLPVWLIKAMNLQIEEGVIKTYYHEQMYTLPIIWPLTSAFMQLLGLYVAEGHTDKRQIGFTFSRHERDLVKLVCDVAYQFGIHYTIEERPEKNSVRVKLFGGILSCLFGEWCGKGAKNKQTPDFVFTASRELRQHYLDYLYRGDGHLVKKKNSLMLTTVSETLANQAVYLWLMQGVIATSITKMNKGFSKTPTKCYVVTVYGSSINTSHFFTTNTSTNRKAYDYNLKSLASILGRKYSLELLQYAEKLSQFSNKEMATHELADLFARNKIGYKIRFMLDADYLIKQGTTYQLSQKAQVLCEEFIKIQKLLTSDFLFLQVNNVETITSGYNWVYDISVPEAENFVGGYGALSCHNSRGQQGIGISAVNLFSQLTTGKPMLILSKIGKNKPAVYMELQLNTKTNEPEILKQETREWEKDHGVRVEFEIEAKYVGGKQSVDEYLKNTAIANPHALIKYKAPDASWIEFPRAVTKLPREPKEIQPHPYGIELGMLITKLKDTKARTLKSFLETEFSRVSSNVAKEICEKAKLEENLRPEKVERQQAEQIMASIKTTKIMSPPTDCLSPIGEESLLKGLRKEVDAEFYAAVTRPPAVYRGNPFQIEVAVAFGGAQPTDDLIRLVRFANRVPLLYQQSACVTTKSVIATAWKNYGVSQSRGALPSGPITLVVHMASVWVPFTSESKEAMASYPEIMHEMKLAIQELGRRLASHVRKIKRVEHEKERKKIFELYVEEVAESLKILTKCSKEEIAKELLKYARKQTLSEDEEQQLEDIKKKKSQAVKRSEVDE